jgi:AcrR family transcriptional regulator
MPRRADAERNRDKILTAARAALAEQPGASMAEIARRAGVGMATLYRNFPGRRELLEALYTDEVDLVVSAATATAGAPPGDAFLSWLHAFIAFSTGKRAIASELLSRPDADPSMFNTNRDRVLASGRPLLAAAQAAGDIRTDLTLEQILDTIIALARIHGDATYLAPILQVAFDGLRPPA